LVPRLWRNFLTVVLQARFPAPADAPRGLLKFFAVSGGLLALAPSARAADYYVAPSGNDSNAGTMAAPFATVERGQQAASAGDTVYVRGGVYMFSSSSRTVGVSFSKAGTQSNPIRYFAYPGETPIFDLFQVTPNARVTGFDVNTSYVHIRGMEIRGVRQLITGDSWSVRIRGNGNVIEQLNVHDGEAPGIFITSGSNNLILNCDSHHNYDPLEGGGNADGFGCHSTGGGNVIRGCRGYWNSDDGYDFINAPGVCTVESSWAFNNGYRPETTTAAGNGAGFKAGGFGLDPGTFPNTIPRHVVRQCVAFGNRAQGFYANHHPGGIDFFNNTAFRNGANYNMLADVGASNHTIRNNIALSPGGTITNLTGGTDTSNSWNLGVTVTTDDFLSTMESEAILPREADGSLPNVSFMRLSPGSDLIDKGVDVGLPFAGSAPDLGAFESGLAAGAGGMGGTAGTGGTAGASGSAGAAAGASGAGNGGAAGDMGAGGVSGASGAGTSGASGAMAAGGTGGALAGGSGVAGSASGGTSGGSGVTGGTGGALPAGSGGTGGPAAAGGAVASGGSLAAGGSGTGGSMTGSGGMALGVDDGTEDVGCGCRMGKRTDEDLGWVLVALAVFLARRRRRSSEGL
jgi:hypothetical protein